MDMLLAPIRSAWLPSTKMLKRIKENVLLAIFLQGFGTNKEIALEVVVGVVLSWLKA